MKFFLDKIGSFISIVISATVMAFPFGLFMLWLPDLFLISPYINVIYYIIYITTSIVVSANFDVFLRKKFLKITNEIKNFENGDIYEGEMRNGKMEGKGIYRFSSGERYEGEFKNNMFDGKGVYFYIDGSKKVGFFKNDELIK